MMFNIKTGWGGISTHANHDIAILVSSLHKLIEAGVPFVFSDRHAYLHAARFFDDLVHLDQIDWDILKRRDFKRDPNDPAKLERYQAEALAYEHVPVEGLLGIACYDEASKAAINADMTATGASLRVVIQPGWYFS